MIYPFEVRTVTTDAYEMEYIVFGEGKTPFVMIPGISMSSVIFSAEFIAAAYARFGASHTVYVFDRKKHVTPGYSVEDMAADTADAMRRLRLANADVFGTSQGGMIAQRIAENAPELVGRLILASTLARPNETSRAVFDRWCELSAAGDIRALNRDVFYHVYSDEYLAKYRRAFSRLERSGTQEELRRFTVLAEACRRFDGWQELTVIRCPVLVIGSEKDRTVSAQGSREIAEKLGCALYLYEGYGHAVYDEAPDYKDRIAEFFA